MTQRKTSEGLIRDIKRKTRRKYSSEEKIRIVVEGMRGETSIAELCRREGIAQILYYRWSKGYMESGRKRLWMKRWSVYRTRNQFFYHFTNFPGFHLSFTCIGSGFFYIFFKINHFPIICLTYESLVARIVFSKPFL